MAEPAKASTLGQWADDSDDDGPPPGFEAKDKPSSTEKPAAAATNGSTGDEPGSTNRAAAANVSREADALADQLGQAVTVESGSASTGAAEDATDPETELATAEANSIYKSAATFEELNLREDLLKGLYVEMGFERPSSIQANTLPRILAPPFPDLIAQAHNGSGKTTCFALAMLSRVDPSKRQPQALCVCNTRELVVQNLSVIQRMGKFSGITATSTAQDMDGARRKQPVVEQIVVGTHGKLKSWANTRLLNLQTIVILVFDEADEMLKADGFADDSLRLIKTIRQKNPTVQLLLFSATFNDTVMRFATSIAPKAITVKVKKEELSLDIIAQYNVQCGNTATKSRVLKEMIFPNCTKLGQTIIFVRTRNMAVQLHKEMEELDYKCTSIQGDMQPAERDKVVQEFRDGVTKILLATDVLARGFDVSQVTLVINFDVPVERDQRTPAYETYMHRIGRSGRFGRKGAAFNLLAGAEDEAVMDQIAQHYNKQIMRVEPDNEDEFVAALKAALG